MHHLKIFMLIVHMKICVVMLLLVLFEFDLVYSATMEMYTEVNINKENKEKVNKEKIRKYV